MNNDDVADISKLAYAFVQEAYDAIGKKKPDASVLEVEGFAYMVLSNTLKIYAEQLSTISESTGTEGTGNGSSEVQEAGINGGTEESPQGIRSEQASPSTGSRKKPRHKKR